MPVYIDQPRWERWHGLSGHMVADEIAELMSFGDALGLDQRCFMGDSVCIHYQVPASVRDRAIAAGAIALDRSDFMRKIAEIQQRRGRSGPAPKAEVTIGRRCKGHHRAGGKNPTPQAELF